MQEKIKPERQFNLRQNLGNGFGTLKTQNYPMAGTATGITQDSFFPQQSLPILVQHQSCHMPFVPQQQIVYYYQQQSQVPQLAQNNLNNNNKTASFSFGQNPTVASCQNEICQLKSQTSVNPSEKQRFLEYARQLGLNIVCVDCAQHDYKQIIEKVKQDGDIYLFVNSSKLPKPFLGSTTSNESSFSNSTIPMEISENTFSKLSQQQKQSSNNPTSTVASCKIPSLTSILTATPSQSPQPQQLYNITSSTNNTNNLSNCGSSSNLAPNSKNIITNNLNNGQISLPQNNYMNLYQTQFNLYPSNEKTSKEGSNTTSMQVPPFNYIPNQQSSSFAIPVLLNQQENNNGNNKNNNPLKINFLQANHQLVQHADLHSFINPQLSSQQTMASKCGEVQPAISSLSSSDIKKDAALPKQRHGLFKKTSLKRTSEKAREFRVKVENGQEEYSSSGRDSHNNNLIQTSPNEADQYSSSSNSSSAYGSYSDENNGKKENHEQMNVPAGEIEKQNKIKERRKTNNFGHIYTWLKNQIRLYFGDRELYEKIQSYFTRVNKYNEVVTDESSSKWQYFLYQCKDNVALKTFLKDKIKSEHFKEYIKTRKGKDQKVFYEFRIGVIYGIDHPELSNQPKNCLLMAKKDPEYNQISFGW